MAIKGFQGTSLLDFPGRIASLVFFGGCNLTCPFCHNPSLVLSPGQYPDYPLDALLEELAGRRPFIDGVVVSGGEPTLDGQLPALLEGARSLGLATKLDTNGLLPEVLEELLSAGLVDYLALDLKTAPRRYGQLHGAPVTLGNLERSAQLVMNAGIDYEFRTTCVPGLVTEEDIRELGGLVQGGRRWYLQQFLPGPALAAELQQLDAYAPRRLEALADLAREFVGEVGLRGV